jgi:hypothetical protein
MLQAELLLFGDVLIIAFGDCAEQTVPHRQLSGKVACTPPSQMAHNRPENETQHHHHTSVHCVTIEFGVVKVVKRRIMAGNEVGRGPGQLVAAVAFGRVPLPHAQPRKERDPMRTQQTHRQQHTDQNELVLERVHVCAAQSDGCDVLVVLLVH